MADDHRTRRRPHILITGTPGTGKTSLAAHIASRLCASDGAAAQHISVGEIAQTHRCYEGRDEELDTNILDEDKLLDILEVIFRDAEVNNKSCVADFHVCEIFPERWFDLVLVLRTNTEILFDRLERRGYGIKKRDENMESEIMQVILEEARESYDPNIVHEVYSNNLEDMESNTVRILEWVKNWMANQEAMEDDES